MRVRVATRPASSVVGNVPFAARMISRCLAWLLPLIAVAGCGLETFETPQRDTVLLVANKSRESHLLFEVETPDGTPKRLDLLPPGGGIRRRFYDIVEQPCPVDLIVRAHLLEYDDAGQLTTVASGQTEVHPWRCMRYTDAAVFDVYLRDTPRGHGTLLFTQDTPCSIRFDFHGVNLPAPQPGQLPAEIDDEKAHGFVLDLQGRGVGEIGVIIWSVYRSVALPCSGSWDDAAAGTQVTTQCGTEGNRSNACCNFDCPGNQFGKPLETTVTDDDGRFEFHVPPGVYYIEVFADGKLFRPAYMMIEAPLDNVVFLAEDDDGRELEVADDGLFEDDAACADSGS